MKGTVSVAVVVATEDGGAGATGEQGDAGVEVRQAAEFSLGGKFELTPSEPRRPTKLS